MRLSRSLWLLTTLVASAPALAMAEPAPSAFGGLWTGWDSVNREALRAETEAMQRLRQSFAEADAQQMRALRNEGRALGERVGEIVRLGDCEEGERIARAAGDFALVEAVRSHCRPADPAAARVSTPVPTSPDR